MAKGKKRKSPNASLNTVSEVQEMKNDIILALREEIKSLKCLFESVKNENALLKTQQLQITAQISDLKIENNRLQQQVEHSNAVFNKHEQYSRRNSVRIFGIREEQNESNERCQSKVTNMLKQELGIIITPHDIDTIHRTGRFRNDQPRAIILKFVRRNLKENVLREKRNLKGTGVVVVEDLTRQNLKLLKDVRDHPSVQSAWTSNGKVIAITLYDESRINVSGDRPIDEQLPRISSSASTSATTTTRTGPSSSTTGINRSVQLSRQSDMRITSTPIPDSQIQCDNRDSRSETQLKMTFSRQKRQSPQDEPPRRYLRHHAPRSTRQHASRIPVPDTNIFNNQTGF